MTPSEIFRQNIRLMAATMRIETVNALAKAIGFEGEDTKWLRRAWMDGISRPDPRKRRQLEQVAAFFKQAKVQDLWNPQSEVSPYTLMERRQEWQWVVHRILDCFRLLQQAKLRGEEPVRNALARYGFIDELFIADWVATEFGQRRPEFEELDKSSFAATQYEFISSWKFVNWFLCGDAEDGNVPLALWEFVAKRASSHPNWEGMTEYVRDVYRQLHGIPDGPDLEAHVHDSVMKILDGLRYRPLSPQEILDEFTAFYLDWDGPRARAVEDGSKSIIEQLMLHPQWPRWVELKYDGDYEEAEYRTAQEWKKALSLLGDKTITPQDFVGYLYLRLNELKPEDQ